MPIDKVARALVARVDQTVQPPDVPHEVVQCQCPAPCWASKNTIDGLKKSGLQYQFHCTQCAPDELKGVLRGAAERILADPKRDKSQPVTGIFSPEMGIILEGLKPEEMPNLIEAMASGEVHPREREPVTITMTLDVGEWVDILTTLAQTSKWLEKQKSNDPVHPRGPTHMSDLYAKVKRFVLYEVGRQVHGK